MRIAVRVLLVVALLAMVSLGASAAPKTQKVTLTLTEFQFSPKNVTLQAGVPVELTLVNKGTVEHEFLLYAVPKGKVEDMDAFALSTTYFKDTGEIVAEFPGVGMAAAPVLFETEVVKGKRVTLKFTPAKKGTFEYGCHVEGHYDGGMKGTLIVK